MNAPLSREEAINLRTAEIMLDGDAIVELIDKINRHGGLAALSLASGLRQWFYGSTVFIRERGADQATNVVNAFAFLQASNEYDARPLLGGGA